MSVEVKQQCKVCGKQYATEYRNWYDKHIPWVCSSPCFIRLVREAYEPIFDRVEADPRVKRFYSPVGATMRSSYEREFRMWLHNNLPWDYEPYSFTLENKSRYVPDFLLDGKLFVEVKGLWNSEGKKKFISLTKEFYDLPIIVVDKPFLRMLKRITK